MLKNKIFEFALIYHEVCQNRNPCSRPAKMISHVPISYEDNHPAAKLT